MSTLNGTVTPEQLGDLAHQYAKDVYQYSEQSLMAHSIRAVQAYLEANGKGKHWISVKMSPAGKYLGKRAIAIIQADETEICVAQDAGFEDQRRGIAHELAHLLIVKFGKTKVQVPEGVGVTGNQVIESACEVFEKDLCKRHHVFYSTEENRQRLLFHSLDDHPSPTN